MQEFKRSIKGFTYEINQIKTLYNTNQKRIKDEKLRQKKTYSELQLV